MIRAATILLSLALLGGCASGMKEWQPDSKAKVYRVATRQLTPEPVYSRLTWVRPPEMMPDYYVARSTAPAVMPVMHLDVKDSTLEEVARLIASTLSYGSYCSSLIAAEKITLNRLGTIEELGDEIERSARIKVLIDHGAKQVKFLADKSIAPAFF